MFMFLECWMNGMTVKLTYIEDQQTTKRYWYVTYPYHSVMYDVFLYFPPYLSKDEHASLNKNLFPHVQNLIDMAFL